MLYIDRTELFIRPLIMHIYTFGHATVMMHCNGKASESGDAVGIDYFADIF